MKRILWFDSVGGASGDMVLAALMDLGVPPARVNAALSALGHFHLSVTAEPHAESGLHGTRARVDVHEHHHHHHHDHAHEHTHRGLTEIAQILDASAVSAAVKRQSLAVFRRLAEAEGRVHHQAPEAIHFHEVGALDAIADIVGACEALATLDVDGVGFSPLPAGHGTIRCAHGVIPNPPPGTVELLKGFPTVQVDEPYELVTPTGAALLTTWSSLRAWPTGWTLSKVGHGFGQRRLTGRPNLLRAQLLEPCEARAHPTEGDCLVLETNIDDTSPELIGALTQKLMAAGAWDVYTLPIQMKKQRPGILLTTLCPPELRMALIDLIFRESSTFGIREHLTRRTMLARETATVTTPHGAVRVKIGTWQGQPVTASPEYEDCARCAEAAGVSVRAVYESALAAGQVLLKRSNPASAVSGAAP